MANVLMWIGIGLILAGWLALGWQASKRLASKAELEKYPQRKSTMRLHRNYCFLTIGVGVILLLVAMVV